MNDPIPQELLERFVALLREREQLRSVPDDVIREFAVEWLRENPTAEAAKPGPALLDELAGRVLFRARVSAEERGVRAKLALKLGMQMDDLDAIVHRHFEGATRDIAQRYAQAVRQERARRVTESVLHGLGGDSATLESILRGVAQSVGDAIAGTLGSVPVAEIERQLRGLSGRKATSQELAEITALLRRRAAPKTSGGDVGQIAQAISQAVQQVALNVQKIVTVALENERAADAEHPKYYDP